MAREFTRTLTMEYRGLARKSGTFQDESTGAEVTYGELVRFEYDDDGLTVTDTYRLSEFDTAEGNVDVRRLEKGTLLAITLRLVAYQKRDGTRSWFEAVDHVEQVKRSKLSSVAS